MGSDRKRMGFDRTTTNICKGIAIILMYIHHSFYDENAMMNVQVKTLFLSMPQLMEFAKLCKVCVSIFVFLTAFGVYRSCAEHPFQLTQSSYGVVRKRFVNLWSHFFLVYVAAVLTSPITGMGKLSAYRGEGPVKAIWYLLTDAAGFANAFKGNTLNPTWWYMPFAFFLIFAVPVLAALVDRIGWAFLPVMLLLPSLGGFDTDNAIWRYGLAVALGLVFAKYNVPEQIGAVCRKRTIPRIVPGLACLALGIVFLYFRFQIGKPWIWEPLGAAAICVSAYLMLRGIPLLSKILAVLGKYSMYMFLLHTFIRSNQSRLHAFSYLPKYPVLIILLLLTDTLVISVLLDTLYRLLQKAFRRANVSRRPA